MTEQLGIVGSNAEVKAPETKPFNFADNIAERAQRVVQNVRGSINEVRTGRSSRRAFLTTALAAGGASLMAVACGSKPTTEIKPPQVNPPVDKQPQPPQTVDAPTQKEVKVEKEKPLTKYMKEVKGTSFVVGISTLPSPSNPEDSNLIRNRLKNLSENTAFSEYEALMLHVAETLCRDAYDGKLNETAIKIYSNKIRQFGVDWANMMKGIPLQNKVESKDTNSVPKDAPVKPPILLEKEDPIVFTSRITALSGSPVSIKSGIGTTTSDNENLKKLNAVSNSLAYKDYEEMAYTLGSQILIESHRHGDGKLDPTKEALYANKLKTFRATFNKIPAATQN